MFTAMKSEEILFEAEVVKKMDLRFYPVVVVVKDDNEEKAGSFPYFVWGGSKICENRRGVGEKW